MGHWLGNDLLLKNIKVLLLIFSNVFEVYNFFCFSMFIIMPYKKQSEWE